MSYGATASDIAAFNAIGSSDVERLTLWVDDQLDWEAIDDSAVESRLAADAELRAELEALRRTIALVRTMPEMVAPRDLRHRRR